MKIYVHGKQDRQLSWTIGGSSPNGFTTSLTRSPARAGRRNRRRVDPGFPQGQHRPVRVLSITRFFSPASQKAQTLTILPMLELIDDLTTRATVIWPWELVFEDFLLSPSADDIFDGLSSMMIRTAMAGCFIEAATSEHLSRVVAMRNATDNADEMIEDLTQGIQPCPTSADHQRDAGYHRRCAGHRQSQVNGMK